ncbi:class I SAM-dependent methyltransferase [Xanthocytophaga agilis]|uniref:Class I SAM-dependent methyltransferase n=1 Tax=Xanthocytophaga agilis TaxID=3048010 RepID=A0AAE3RAL6_9BACT|nr:class I SAM-dependent methyltransferase [Xanthocytophaga agilis]MDJ1506270.1 class I SAM-dependent methyltransferase [Xanthocytophaga agilis]
MSKKSIRKTFLPILEFMEVKPGMRFADVGAGSGTFTVMMASLMDSATVYIQDIDRQVLNEENVEKMVDFYSQQGSENLRDKVQFHLIIGDTIHSNLPDSTLDLIYTNATIHVFNQPDAMFQDLHKKLKHGGRIFIRDSFKNDHGAGEFCSDPTCAKPLLSIADFLSLMQKNGFKLLKQSSDMSGYPVFGFTQSD